MKLMYVIVRRKNRPIAINRSKSRDIFNALENGRRVSGKLTANIRVAKINSQIISPGSSKYFLL